MVVVGFLKDYNTMISSLYIDVFEVETSWQLHVLFSYSFRNHNVCILPILFYFYLLSTKFLCLEYHIWICCHRDLSSSHFKGSMLFFSDFLHGNLSHNLVLYVSLIRRLAFFLVRNIQSNHGIIPSQYQIFG